VSLPISCGSRKAAPKTRLSRHWLAAETLIESAPPEAKRSEAQEGFPSVMETAGSDWPQTDF
jgi:hypothetical protein